MSKKLPEWAKRPFEEFLDHQDEARDVLMLSIQGISLLPNIPNAIQVLMEVKHELDSADATDYAHRLEVAKRLAELAQRQLDTDFPLLYSQRAVALWNALECLIRDFLATWLAKEPSATQVEGVAKIKIPLADYEAMSLEERHYFIIDMLEREHRIALRQGINRLEDLLGMFGLSGPVKDETQKDLFELCQIRHVLVHRRGLADSRLIQACPWLDLKPGDPVIITPDMAYRYWKATDDYVAAVIHRVRSHLSSSGPAAPPADSK